MRSWVSAARCVVGRQAVIGVLDAEVVPLLRKCSLAGHAEYKTHNKASALPLIQDAACLHQSSM